MKKNKFFISSLKERYLKLKNLSKCTIYCVHCGELLNTDNYNYYYICDNCISYFERLFYKGVKRLR